MNWLEICELTDDQLLGLIDCCLRGELTGETREELLEQLQPYWSAPALPEEDQ